MIDIISYYFVALNSEVSDNNILTVEHIYSEIKIKY